ncbi:MAG: sterol desaturase family protein [Candidatus Obscuribacterales bacterium]|nr:sterol desaturase family protein [Steroidobacteraceae bacterium]
MHVTELDASVVKPIIAFTVLVALLAWESVAPYFSFFRGHARQRAVHAVRNFTLAVLNAVVGAIVLATLWTWVTQWSARHEFGVLHWLPLGVVGNLVVGILLFDAWMYAWHRLNHRVSFLWRWHRVHHSDPQMDVTTAHRFHIGEIVLSGLLRAPVLLLLGMSLTDLALYETLMFAVVQFHHANVALPPALDRALRTIIVTPNLHKVHHSRLRVETDSNYSSLFSWWDRLFGSLRLRTDPHSIEFGLPEFAGSEHQTLSGMLKMPGR